jgi:rhodanese-related sulfurtransferase
MPSVFSTADIEVTTEQTAQALAEGSAQVIDVREQYEWDAGRTAGAKHIELERLAGRSGEIDRERPVIFQCRLGRRSAFAVEAFRNAGYDAYNMAGGILAWNEAGLPLEPEGGEVAPH